jgi:hypothetical protein
MVVLQVFRESGYSAAANAASQCYRHQTLAERLHMLTEFARVAPEPGPLIALSKIYLTGYSPAHVLSQADAVHVAGLINDATSEEPVEPRLLPDVLARIATSFAPSIAPLINNPQLLRYGAVSVILFFPPSFR